MHKLEMAEFLVLNNASTKPLTNQPTNNRSHFVFAESCAAAALSCKLQPPLISPQPQRTDGRPAGGRPTRNAIDVTALFDITASTFQVV